MSWLELTKVGEHFVYDIEPSKVVIDSRTISFLARDWSLSTTKASLGETVDVFVPLGGLSGEHKHAVVRLSGGEVEIWCRNG